MKKFFRHWQYGIKAKVVDRALVAQLDTAREPTFVRLDLSRLLTVAIEVANKGTEYELNMVGVGAPGATTTLARFEVRDAAEEAADGLRRALLRGEQPCRFTRAFLSTLGILAAIGLTVLLVAAFGGLTRGGGGSTGLAIPNLQSQLSGAAAPVNANPGEPMSADQFLSNAPASPAPAE